MTHHAELKELLKAATSQLLAAAAHADAQQWDIVSRRIETAQLRCRDILKVLDERGAARRLTIVHGETETVSLDSLRDDKY